MEYAKDIKINNEAALSNAIVELKLFVNRRLYEKRVITEEMYTRANELILKEGYTYHTTNALTDGNVVGQV